MSEDVSYTVRVPPNSNTVFEIHQIYGNSTFKFHSTRTVMACFLNSITNVCENNGTNSKANLLTEGILVLEDMSLHNNRIEIYNPFDDNAAEVTAVVHSGTFKHCERLKLGRVYSRAVSAN